MHTFFLLYFFNQLLPSPSNIIQSCILYIWYSSQQILVKDVIFMTNFSVLSLLFWHPVSLIFQEQLHPWGTGCPHHQWHFHLNIIYFVLKFSILRELKQPSLSTCAPVLVIWFFCKSSILRKGNLPRKTIPSSLMSLYPKLFHCHTQIKFLQFFPFSLRQQFQYPRVNSTFFWILTSFTQGKVRQLLWPALCQTGNSFIF